MELYEIIIGLITAVFLVFIKEAHSKANIQKVIATRLKSYLIYWKELIIENDFFNLFYEGIKWNKEEQEIVKNGGNTKDIIELKNKKKEELEKFKKFLTSDEGRKSLKNETFLNIISKMPDNPAEHLLEFAKISSQNLIDGKTFVSDVEVANLGPLISQLSIETKLELISAINLVVSLLVLAIKQGKDFNLEENVDDILKLVWKCINISKRIDQLYNSVELYSKKPILELTMLNLNWKK